MVSLEKLKNLFNHIPHWDYQEYSSMECGFEQNYFESRGGERSYVACIVIPHSGNNNRWLLRINDNDTFDKWGNCDYEYFYSSASEAIEKLVEFYNEIIA